jgi:hypothetical protein
LISLFLGLAVVTQGQAEDYYIYQTPKGELVLTNKEPPPEAKSQSGSASPMHLIMKLHRTNQVIKPQSNGPTDSSPKPSKGK